MFRTLVCLVAGLGLFCAYVLAAIMVMPLILWQQATGTEPEVEFVGTDLSPY